MDPLETLLSPVARILNRNIQETTPAHELCRNLNGKTVAIRVKDTALAMYFEIRDEVVLLAADSDAEPDVAITGSLLTLAGMAKSANAGALRDGSLDLTGDAYTAQAFQELLALAKPDIEEELSMFVGDVAAHRVGKLARAMGGWAREARSTMGSNIREYLQEERGEVPSRYEVERFAQRVDSLRDDVARLEARFDRLMSDT